MKRVSAEDTANPNELKSIASLPKSPNKVKKSHLWKPPGQQYGHHVAASQPS